MRKKQLPLKLRVLEWALDRGKAFTAQQAYDGVKDEYKGEGFCNLKHIERLIGAYCGVLLMDASDEPAPGDVLDVQYVVTAAGKEAGKLIPGRA